jgi:2-methylcitrate dehydratase PrpD
MDVLTAIAEHVTRVQYDDLPAAVVERTKQFILDSLGVAFAGVGAPGCREVVQLVTEWGGRPESTVLSGMGKIPAPWAALANSTMMHALDFDDTLDESALHAHVSVLPATLAVSEAEGTVTGKDLICAVVLGVDVLCRIGLGTRRPLSWIRTATCGSFGAAVAAAKVMGLGGSGIRQTLGVVYSQTSGNAQCLVDGGLVKRMQPAFSAKAGVLSAYLARAGISGASDPFEGQYGFFNLYEHGDYDAGRVVKDLGSRYEGMSLSMKPYPSCRMTHASIDAALAILNEERLDPSAIDEATVYVSAMTENMVGRPFGVRENPQVDAQFSIPYTVTRAFLQGGVYLRDFEAERVKQAAGLDLIGKVRVVVDPALPERDMSRARLVVRCGSTTYEKSTEHMRGSPENPLSMEECVAKFLHCVDYGGNASVKVKAQQIIDAVSELETLDNVKTLAYLLG